MSQTSNGSSNGAIATPPLSSQASVEERESFVAFKTAEKVALRGVVGRVTNHSAIFELYNPNVVLNASEVLSDFRIYLQGQAIYSGRAVVHSLADAGARLICEVKLDEAHWTKVNANLLLKTKANIAQEFKTFLQDWQKFYTVTPEFKVAVADLQTFLHSLQLWLNQIELQFNTTATGKETRIKDSLTKEIGNVTTPVLNHMFEKFESVARKVTPDSHASHGAFAKHMLHPLLLCSPFLHRTFVKPLGYAGDYEMVNMLHRNPLEGNSLFAKIINLWFWEQPPAEAHRNRLSYLTKSIEREALRALRKGRKSRVFNFACGPAVEIQELLKTSPLGGEVEFTLSDFNAETLEYTKQSLSVIKGFSHQEKHFRFQKKSVHQLLKDSDKIAAANHNPNLQFDLVYCAGLFDYLSDRTCKELMDAFYQFVAPGGLLISTNVDSSNPRQPTMDLIMEWHLIYRNATEFLTLCPAGATPEDCSVLSDETGVNIFMEVRKPDKG